MVMIVIGAVCACAAEPTPTPEPRIIGFEPLGEPEAEKEFVTHVVGNCEGDQTRKDTFDTTISIDKTVSWSVGDKKGDGWNIQLFNTFSFNA